MEEKNGVLVFYQNCWKFRNRSLINVPPGEQQIKKSFLVYFSANCPNRLSPLAFPAQVADNTMDGGPIFLIFSFLLPPIRRQKQSLIDY